MNAARRCDGGVWSASKRSAAFAALALALAVPHAALADEQLAAVRAGDGAPAAAAPSGSPAATAPASGPRVSFEFLTASAAGAPAAQQPRRSGIAGLADRATATWQRLSDPHAQQHWGYAHGQVMFSFRTGGR